MAQSKLSRASLVATLEMLKTFFRKNVFTPFQIKNFGMYVYLSYSAFQTFRQVMTTAKLKYGFFHYEVPLTFYIYEDHQENIA